MKIAVITILLVEAALAKTLRKLSAHVVKCPPEPELVSLRRFEDVFLNHFRPLLYSQSFRRMPFLLHFGETCRTKVTVWMFSTT